MSAHERGIMVKVSASRLRELADTWSSDGPDAADTYMDAVEREIARLEAAEAARGDVVVTVDIPGSFSAAVAWDGDAARVLGYTFMPHGSGAGYFGPSAEVTAVEPADHDYADEAVGMMNETDVDGAFWRSVQADQADGGPITVAWTE